MASSTPSHRTVEDHTLLKCHTTPHSSDTGKNHKVTHSRRMQRRGKGGERGERKKEKGSLSSPTTIIASELQSCHRLALLTSLFCTSNAQSSIRANTTIVRTASSHRQATQNIALVSPPPPKAVVAAGRRPHRPTT